MALPTQHYVDPSIGTSTGTGTSGDPYGTLEYARSQVALSPDTSNGDQYNIKSSSTTTITGTFTQPAYNENAKEILRGFTTSAEDGGMGIINGNGNPIFLNGNYFIFQDMELYSANATQVIAAASPSSYCALVNCKIHGGYRGAQNIYNVVGCYIYDIRDYAILGTQTAIGNLITPGATYTPTYAIYSATQNINIINNCIRCGTGTKHGIYIPNNYGLYAVVQHNSIYGAGSGGIGIYLGGNGSAMNRYSHIANNIVSSFSATGGYGLKQESTTRGMQAYGCNSFYYCDTNSQLGTGTVWAKLGDDETLASDPFTDAANDDFSLVAGVVSDGYPATIGTLTTNIQRGAIQRAASSGGSAPYNPFTPPYQFGGQI